jgi:Protein kinase domain/FG-GAP-like repeat
MRHLLFLVFLLQFSPLFAYQGSDSLYFSAIIPFKSDEFAFSICPLGEKSVWYGTNKGVFYFNGDTIKKHLDKSDFAQKELEMLNVVALSDSAVWAVAIEPANWEKRMFFFDGKKWQQQFFPQFDDNPKDDLAIFRLDIIKERDEIVGYVAGQEGLVYKLKNNKWEILKPFTNSTLRALHIQNKNSVWVGGAHGMIFHFDGITWQRFPTIGVDTTNYILDIDFISVADGWAVGTKEIWHFDGRRWSPIEKPATSYLRDIEMISKDEGWAMGHNGEVLRYDGKKWALFEEVPSKIQSTQIGVKWVREYQENKIFITGTQGIYMSKYGKWPTFSDYTESANIHASKGKPTFADFDRNSTLDVIVSGYFSEPLRLYSNSGNGFFSEMTQNLKMDIQVPGRNIRVADIDNNGLPDIYLSRNPSKDIWFANMGNWVFEERESPITLDETANRSAVYFADFNNDGSLDLLSLVSFQTRRDSILTIYLNNGVGEFEKKVRFGKSISNSSAFGWLVLRDFNNDGLMDIYAVNFTEPSQMFMNRGDLVFDEVAESIGLDGTILWEKPYISDMDVADFNNDGLLDISIVERHGKTAIFLNDSTFSFSIFQTFNNSFVDFRAASFADFNCDGQTDFYFYDKLFLNQNGQLKNISSKIGFLPAGSSTVADIDRDGDGDLWINTKDGLTINQNNCNPDNPLFIQLKGVRSNAFAIGAQVKLWNVSKGDRSLAAYKQVHDTEPLSFYLEGQNQYDLEVIFPSGQKRYISKVRGGNLELNEFPFLLNIFWDFVYAFKRTLILMSFKIELIKFSIFALISVLFFLFVKNIRILKSGHHKFSVFIFFIAYVLLVHISMRSIFIVSFIVPIAGVFLLQLLLYFIIRQRLIHLEANYISHFRLQQPIGVGGMGKVYRAFDVHSKKTVAVKIINNVVSEDSENKSRLLSEGQVMTRLNHPNVVKVKEMGKTENKDFIVMEYLENGTLKKYIRENKPLAEKEIVRIVLQIIDGLHTIHSADIVHRDLTSFNIMLDASNNMRIMDFGLSKSPLITSMTTLGTVVGTLGYTAPEQVTGGKIDTRSDIFSLGVVMYELLTGKLPFTGENEMALIHSIFNYAPEVPSRLRPDIHPCWDRIITKCLAKNMDDRPESVHEISQELEAVFNK